MAEPEYNDGSHQDVEERPEDSGQGTGTESVNVCTVKARVPTRRKEGNPTWVPGQSGNPAGRKKGSKNKATLYKEAVLLKQKRKLLDALPGVLDVVIEQAMAGDSKAQKLYLDRIEALKIADEDAGKGNKEIVININGAASTSVNGKTIEAEIIEE
jgi:hypothetical protein